MLAAALSLTAEAQPGRWDRPFETDSPMVHDPVMAVEDGTYHLFSTGIGIQHAWSRDMKKWTVDRSPVMTVIPQWTTDSVAGFRDHVWAPDIIRWHGRWWMAYSCSTFGKNGSAIGLMSNRSLRGMPWQDEGCIVCSRDKRDNWNAIDPNFIIDDNDCPWMTFGSFWDGIQIVRLDTTMHIAAGERPRTIARRYSRNEKNAAPNPTSKYAGRNAIEAPFILRHDGYYYLFVSWDYCCRGELSNYKVAVGRSRNVDGPYLDRDGKDMLDGGGTIVIEGDKKDFEAIGHCAAYDVDGKQVYISHGYSLKHKGSAVLVKRDITWKDGWPVIAEK